MISLLVNLLRFICGLAYGLSWRMFHVFEKNVHSVPVC